MSTHFLNIMIKEVKSVMKDMYISLSFGLFHLAEEDGALVKAKRALEIPKDWTYSFSPVLETAKSALLSYEAGVPFEEVIPIRPICTPFEEAVFREISKIPFGETACYGEIAERIGKKGASRAVGQALNRNPIWIFIPCHRVIGKNKALTGFAGGLELKRMLLAHERAYLAKSSAICTAFVAAPFRT